MQNAFLDAAGGRPLAERTVILVADAERLDGAIGR